jgi:predicted esterase
MKRRRALGRYWRRVACSLILALAALPVATADEVRALQPGALIEIPFLATELPPTLFSMMQGVAYTPVLTFRLPDDYTAEGSFPLVVYVPGNDGNAHGNMHNATTIAGPDGWIAATVPLFKHSIDRSEPAGGVIVSLEDYPVLAKAYATMLGRLFERVPNIDREKSAMVGFSNGAITIGVLVSHHDEFILTRFRNFCLVDQGMFHLADLHKSRARDSRFLLLVGDQEDFGRELRLRQAQLQQDAWRLLDVNINFRILENTGHEFLEPQMAVVTDWLRTEVAPVSKPAGNGETLTP